MSSEQSSDVALQQLQTQHRELLDNIDQLRSQGLDEYVQLPRLIVCGDQSSGKSSVLDAISRFRFPAKSTACTRFATELVLRRAPTSKITISVRAGRSRKSAEEKERVQKFGSTLTDSTQFAALIEEAGKCMGVSKDGDRRYTDDVLHVEVSGPDQPHLTLVDLPGFIRTASDRDDIQMVRSMVKGYMKEKRTVILAIVEASHDWATQEILDLVKDEDPDKTRTLGIITKPDKVEHGSALQTSYLRILRNEDEECRLKKGWHVVLNRGESDTETSNTERDQNEKDFLSAGKWQQIASRQKGAAALRDRLSNVLLDEIRSNLPHVISDIRSQIAQCKDRMKKLGRERTTASQQRQYLTHISSEFQRLVVDASNGRFSDRFFLKSEEDDKWRNRMLRAMIHKLNAAFVQKMIRNGHRRQVLPSASASEHELPDIEGCANDRLDSSPFAGPGWAGTVTRERLMRELNLLARDIRGNEFENFPNSQLVVHLFREQAAHWQEIGQRYLQRVWDATTHVIRLILKHLAIEEVETMVYRHLIKPWLQEKWSAMDTLLALLVRPYVSEVPNTLNPNFLRNISRQQESQALRCLKTSLGADPTANRRDASFSLHDIEKALNQIQESRHGASSTVLCTTEAFYEVSSIRS